MDKIAQLENDIKNLTIQGATNVALAVLEGIEIAAKKTDENKIYDLLKSTAQRLAFARPTEPLAQNAIQFVLSDPAQSVDYYLSKVEEYKNLIISAKAKMGEYAQSVIEDGGVYLTHCHSSTVVSLFKNARKQGKIFSVIATETRPLFQGRKTVKELLDAGFEDVTLIIDDAAESIINGRLKRINGVFIGADLLSDHGFVNKIGSLGIAYSTMLNNIPFYCVTILLKFSPIPYHPRIIEQRSGMEIWDQSPSNLKFYSPAFDYIPYNTKVKLISEAGIIDDKIGIANTAKSLYTFLYT